MKKYIRPIASLLLVSVLYEIAFPVTAYALTGGPSQPEVQSFEPIGTSEMVDVSSGDFNYNIPLLDVDGYPINIAYHSGIGMDQEASWVGLGWNINPGVINRNMRSLPDDFNGERVKKEYNMRPNETYGATFGASWELFGFKVGGKKGKFDLSANLGVYYNNYKGIGYEMSVRPGISAGDKSKGALTAGLGLSANSDNGFTMTPSIGMKKSSQMADGKEMMRSGSISTAINSRGGLKTLSLGFSSDILKYNSTKDKFQSERRSQNGGSGLSFANPTFVPQIQMPMVNTSVSFNGSMGAELIGNHPGLSVSGYYTEQHLAQKDQLIPAFGFFYSHNAGDGRTLMDFNREKDGSFTKHTPNLPLTNFSYDIYSVSGQGVGGMYKPFRGEVGTVHDPYTEDVSTGGSLGVELGTGGGAHFGVDLNLNVSNNSSGKWVYDNPAGKDLRFRGSKTDDKLYEPVYFRNLGEKSADPDKFLEKTGGYLLIQHPYFH